MTRRSPKNRYGLQLLCTLWPLLVPATQPAPLDQPASVYHLQMQVEVDADSGRISGSQHLRW